jgi:hypothetical protein
MAIDHSGITLMAAASGAGTATVARGVTELAEDPVPMRRVRAPGAGRKPWTVTDPGLLPALGALILIRDRRCYEVVPPVAATA